MKVTACVRGAIFAGLAVLFLLLRFGDDDEEGIDADDARVLLELLLLISGFAGNDDHEE